MKIADHNTYVVPSECPFDKSQELDGSLERDSTGNVRSSHEDPSTGRLEPSLPGQPSLRLHDARRIEHYLAADILTPDLDTMSPHLWLVSTQDSAHVSALHAQLVRGRCVVTTENPELHLLWIDDRVFVKPIPPYLLSHTFWTTCLNPAASRLSDAKMVTDLRRGILGYLRTWTLLVRHESDFRLAKDNFLVPEPITFAQFRAFIDHFSSDRVTDEEVSSRYHFGELRLSRLNFWAKIFLRRWMFQKVQWQYWQYFAQYYGPLLFIFGVLSVVLSAMQVAISTSGIWQRFSDVAKWFSVLTLLIIASIIGAMLTMLLAMIMREFVFAIRTKIKKGKGR